MHSTLRIALAASLLALPGLAPALSGLSPDAPRDKPGHVRGDDQAQRFLKAVAPYIAQARQTWPAARNRFLAGLPPRHVFFVTMRLIDATGRFEIVFLEVHKIEQGVISGEIANDLTLVKGYHRGEMVTVPETEIWDWTISRPDGSEEGNVVGKFLETYRP